MWTGDYIFFPEHIVEFKIRGVRVATYLFQVNIARFAKIKMYIPAEGKPPLGGLSWLSSV